VGHGVANVSLSAIVLYALPYMSYAVVALPLALFVPSFYADELALPLATVGYAIAASRALDILLDPLIGTLSDHTHTRYGRRKPWIVAGTPLFLLAAWMLLVPGEGVSSTYLLVWTALLFVSFTLVDLPFKAWGAELSTDYGERSRITAWREAFGFAGQLVFVAVLLLLQLSGRDTAHIQLQAVAWTLALTLPPLLALALWVVPEPRPEELSGRRPRGWGALLVLIKNPALQRMLIAVVVFVAAVVVQATLHRLVLAHVILSPEIFPTLLLVENVVTIAAVPLWMWISHRIGKHRALSAAALWAGLWSLALPIFSAGQAWGLCAVLVVRGSSFASILFLANSIAADVVDYDTVASGHQRTGLLFALWAVIYKLAIALGILLATVIPAWFGFEPSAPSPDESAKLALMGVYGWLPGIMMGLGALALWNFPIDEARQRALRALIAERVVR
jgi:GPH family glycoside/pentoside/hexuronide:cation symporter